MRPVCVICTEIFVLNSHISACSCGHIFHEECLFRWFKSSQYSCPQCRAKLKESEVIKRLYLTESDSTSSTQSFSSINSTECAESLKQKYEELLNKYEELKSDLRLKSDNLAQKTKLVEQKESKIKELEEFKTNHKKKLNENLILIDYLKKELETHTRLKEQYDSREKVIFELETKLKGYKSIELIYKENEDSFTSEMRKYIDPTHSLSHLQTVVRQLVSTNVLLKQHLDKQTEDKKALRKKLIQIERIQGEKDKFIAKKEAEMNELNKRLEALETSLKSKEQETDKIELNESNRIISSAKLRSSLSNDDSDIQYLDEIGKFENSYLRKKTSNEIETDSSDDLVIDKSISFKKRKNPFVKSDSNSESENEDSDGITEITPYQKLSKKPTLSQIISSSNKLSSNTDDIVLVKPVEKVAKANRLYKTTSFSGAQSKLNSSNKLDESIEIKPLTKANSTSYHFDGLGGRQKIVQKNDNLKSYFLASAANKNKLSKFKVT